MDYRGSKQQNSVYRKIKPQFKMDLVHSKLPLASLYQPVPNAFSATASTYQLKLGNGLKISF